MGNKIPRNVIPCACGCGGTLVDRDRKGNVRRFIIGHHNSTEASRERARLRFGKCGLPRVPWNKGRSYVIRKRTVYANKSSWNKAMRRLYPNRCMRCGWDEAGCDTHHIVARRDGGLYTLENGIILCPNCHRLANLGKVSADELRAVKARCEVVGRAV
jgi:hypothetical protein